MIPVEKLCRMKDKMGREDRMPGKDQPLLSIIVPVYKVEKYLDQCISSIRAQTYTNLEILLVDDGSPDACPGICDEAARQDGRIQVIHKKNGGLSDARNAGLDVARGQYIGFVDSDDYIAPNMYEVLLHAALTNDADMALCNYTSVRENTSTIQSLVDRDQSYSKREFIEKLTEPGGGYFVVVWNKLYKREIFENLRFPVGKQHEDQFLWHYIIEDCQVIVAVKTPLYYYRRYRSGSIMARGFSVKFMDNGEAMIDRYYFARKHHYVAWKNATALFLSQRMEIWKEHIEESREIKERYEELRKKSRFLVYERSAWKQEGRSLRGNLFMRINHACPAVGRLLQQVEHHRFRHPSQG